MKKKDQTKGKYYIQKVNQNLRGLKGFLLVMSAPWPSLVRAVLAKAEINGKGRPGFQT
jgi:hypothetical protein